MGKDNQVDLDFTRIQKGDLKAYEYLFRKQYSPIVRFAHKIVRDPMVAEEIGQEVFLYIWEKREQINITGSLSAYLYSATKNKCINWLKSELPRIQATMDIAATDLIDPKDDHDPEREKKIKVLVNAAIDDLPNKCREIFLLSRFGGLTYEEIAEDLDLSKKTVENQMGIALKKLREGLKPILTRIIQ